MPILLDIRERRESRGWSQSELSRRSGVPQPMISRLERPPELGGQHGVDFEVLEQLARTLKIHPRDLIAIRKAPTKARVRAFRKVRRKR